jgi:hypothetical protein
VYAVLNELDPPPAGPVTGAKLEQELMYAYLTLRRRESDLTTKPPRGGSEFSDALD